MEILIGILLFLQMLLLLMLLRMDRQILRQMKEQKGRIEKVAEDKKTEQNEAEEKNVSLAVSVQEAEEEKRLKASEQGKLIDEVLSEIFPA